jgi:hypothetical protein
VNIHQTLTRIIDDKTLNPAEKISVIVGFLSTECGLDAANGWYDDDPVMAAAGLYQAEIAWDKYRQA